MLEFHNCSHESKRVREIKEIIILLNCNGRMWAAEKHLKQKKIQAT